MLFVDARGPVAVGVALALGLSACYSERYEMRTATYRFETDPPGANIVVTDEKGRTVREGTSPVEFQQSRQIVIRKRSGAWIPGAVIVVGAVAMLGAGIGLWYKGSQMHGEGGLEGLGSSLTGVSLVFLSLPVGALGIWLTGLGERADGTYTDPPTGSYGVLATRPGYVPTADIVLRGDGHRVHRLLLVPEATGTPAPTVSPGGELPR